MRGYRCPTNRGKLQRVAGLPKTVSLWTGTQGTAKKHVVEAVVESLA